MNPFFARTEALRCCRLHAFGQHYSLLGSRRCLRPAASGCPARHGSSQTPAATRTASPTLSPSDTEQALTTSADPGSRQTTDVHRPAEVYLNHQDVVVDSLDATLEAHARRNDLGQPRIQFYHTSPADRSLEPGQSLQNSAEHRPKPRPPEHGHFRFVDGDTIFSSFEDFKARSNLSDAELARKLEPAPWTDTQPSAVVDPDGERTVDVDGSSSSTLPMKTPKTRGKGNHAKKQRDFAVGRVRPVRIFRPEVGLRLPPNIKHMQHDAAHLRSTSDEFVSIAIRELEHYMGLNRLEKSTVTRMIDETHRIAKELLPEDTLVLHGSHATGLADVLSDVDFNIPSRRDEGSGDAESGQQRLQRLLAPLFKLQKHFRRHEPNSTVTIVHLACPLLMVSNRSSGITLQISSGRMTGANTQFVQSVCDEYPSMRSLLILMRYFLRSRGLNQPVAGGIGSYPLNVMILTALKHSGIQPSRDSLAKQLLAILSFWSDAQINEIGYSATPPITFPKFNPPPVAEIAPAESQATHDATGSQSQTASTGRSNTSTEADNQTHEIQSSMYDAPEDVKAGIAALQSRNEHFLRVARGQGHPNRGPWQLCLQDPIDPSHDLGITAYRIHDVLETIKQVHRELVMLMQRWDESAVSARKRSTSHPLYTLLRTDQAYIRFRKLALQNALQERADLEPSTTNLGDPSRGQFVRRYATSDIGKEQSEM